MLGQTAGQGSDWLTLLKLGGPVVLFLLLMSVVAFTVTMYKLIQFRGCSAGVLNHLDEAVSRWCAGQEHDALAMITDSRSGVALLIYKGMDWLSRDSRDSIDLAAVEAELSRMAQRILTRQASLLGILEQVSYLAPLLGLLGTVLGILNVFHSLAEQGSNANASMLAGGIWEALLTTAMGLCVAIPFALVHAGLQGRINNLRAQIEDMLTRLFTAGLYKHLDEAS